MVEMERRGIPSVLFTAKTFVHDAQRSAASFGLPGLPLAVVPLPFTNQRPEDIHRMVDDAFDQVLAGLTRDVVAPERPEAPPAAETLAYRARTSQAWERMNRDFLKRGWSTASPSWRRPEPRSRDAQGYARRRRRDRHARARLRLATVNWRRTRSWRAAAPRTCRS
jgi:hypothetical protein